MVGVMVRGRAVERSTQVRGNNQAKTAPQVARGLRMVRSASLVLAMLGLAGCAHTNSNMATNDAAPRASRAVHATAHSTRSHAAKMRAVRKTPEARADVTSTIKPAPLPNPIPLPDEALLKRQAAPDCELRTQPAGLSPADVKLATYDYERQCYRQVEGVVRGRLDALQDAVGETIKAVKARGGSAQAPGN